MGLLVWVWVCCHGCGFGFTVGLAMGLPLRVIGIVGCSFFLVVLMVREGSVNGLRFFFFFFLVLMVDYGLLVVVVSDVCSAAVVGSW